MSAFKKSWPLIAASLSVTLMLTTSINAYSQTSDSGADSSADSAGNSGGGSGGDGSSASAGAVDSSVSASAVDSLKKKVAITFESYASSPLAIRDMGGNPVGNSNGPVRLVMMVDIATANASVNPQTHQVDGPTLLRNLSRYSGGDGRSYYAMNVRQPIELDDHRTIQAGTDASPNQILLNVDDFRVTKVLFPTGASAVRGATSRAASAARALNDDIQTNGLTDRSVPPAMLPQNADDASGDVNLPNETDNNEDDAADYSQMEGAHLGYGNQFPSHFLSAPVCSCLGGSCAIKDKLSEFGWRAKKDKKGKWHTFAAGSGQASKNHMGLDIATAAREVGSPVVAAAPGALIIPMHNGKPLYKPGSRVLPWQIKEHGFGFTLRLTHGNGFETQYSHLMSIPENLTWGQSFRRGQRIATMGVSGHATGPHLHFGVKLNGTYQNPRKYLLGDNGDGVVDGRFLAHDCKHQVNQHDVDIEMLTALHAGDSRSRSARTSSSSSRAIN